MVVDVKIVNYAVRKKRALKSPDERELPPWVCLDVGKGFCLE